MKYALLGVLGWIFFSSTLGLLNNWHKLKPKDKVTLWAQLVSITIAIVSVIFSFDADRELQGCIYQKQQANEIVELINRVAQNVQYDIGVPEMCYAKRDGSSIVFSDNETLRAFGEGKILSAQLNAKFKLLGFTKMDVINNFNTFEKSLIEYQKNCKENDNFNEQQWMNDRQKITLASTSLIDSMAISLEGCY